MRWFRAAQYGSVWGEKLARERKDIWTYPGPSVTKRMEMAVSIALHGGSGTDIAVELGSRIGSGPAIAETVPAAFGILVAEQGDTMESIFDGVNIGDETSAIASIIGAVAGTWNGAGSIRKGYQEILERENANGSGRQAERDMADYLVESALLSQGLGEHYRTGDAGLLARI